MHYNISSSYFLPQSSSDKKTLVLDLDETLVHSDFRKMMRKPDLVLNIELDGRLQNVFVLIRPHVEEFLVKMSRLYELVIFTASLPNYANPLINQLQHYRLISHRLFRQHCSYIGGVFVKDLKKLGRNMKDVIMIDVSVL